MLEGDGRGAIAGLEVITEIGGLLSSFVQWLELPTIISLAEV